VSTNKIGHRNGVLYRFPTTRRSLIVRAMPYLMLRTDGEKPFVPLLWVNFNDIEHSELYHKNY